MEIVMARLQPGAGIMAGRIKLCDALEHALDF